MNKTFVVAIRFAVAFVAVSAILSSCASTKDVVYLQDIDKTRLEKLTTQYEARIKKDDILRIIVSGPDKSVVMPYNLTLGETMGFYNPENATLSYLVDKNGEINFPTLGKIKVEGMTRSELVDYLTYVISKDVKDPVVHVSFDNYKVTILGEVRAPGTYNMNSERINIFQALGMAGDMLITAERSDMILIREVDGVPTYHKFDLRNASVLNSDYYFLQQNDILYVRPSARSVATATTPSVVLGTIFSSLSTAMAVTTFVLTLSKK